MIRYIITSTCLGKTILAQSSAGLCYLGAGDRDDEVLTLLQKRFPKAKIAMGDDALKQQLSPALAWINKQQEPFPLPLDVQGTDLQKAVWQQLQAIPYGQTITYSELAQRVGKPKAMRVMGSACGANPLALIIPCHRVVRKDGTMCGFTWGIERKKYLLAQEKNAVKVAA